MNSTDRTSEIVETGKWKQRKKIKRKPSSLDMLIPQQIIARRRLLSLDKTEIPIKCRDFKRVLLCRSFPVELKRHICPRL